jgi:serine/threonine protein kinase
VNANPEGRQRNAEEIVRKIVSDGERDRFQAARRLCGDDELLLMEVLGRLGELLTENLRGESERQRDPMINQKIGGFRIHWKLGSGGNGDVYLATRVNKPHQQVAMKFLTLHTHESDEFRRRFLRERQITALLNHTYIVKLFDADRTKESRPYFVMEYVNGMDFDKYANFHKLTVNARLDLFLKLCEAVQYLHQHLIVHRDLKPSNVMVDAHGKPKVLDFGIAKLIRPEMMDGDLITILDQSPMTMPYASPEQWEGGVITSASDVYSLGVMLFQLLGGRLPVPWADTHLAEYRRLVCTGELPRLSRVIADGHAILCGELSTAALAHRLSGDLDAIVAKALEKDVTERYATVQELAEDIRRHMQFLPVRAQGDSRLYHARRFVRRHRVPVTATVAVILALAIGLGATVHEAQVARRQKAIALDRTAIALDQTNKAKQEARRISQLDAGQQEMLDALQKKIADQTAQGQQLRASLRELTIQWQARIDEDKHNDEQKRGDTSPNQAELLRTRGRNYELLGRLLTLSGDKNGARQAYQSCVANLTAAERAGDISATTAEAMRQCHAGQ